MDSSKNSEREKIHPHMLYRETERIQLNSAFLEMCPSTNLQAYNSYFKSYWSILLFYFFSQHYFFREENTRFQVDYKMLTGHFCLFF